MTSLRFEPRINYILSYGTRATETRSRISASANTLQSECQGYREYIKDDLSWDAERGFHWFTRGGKKIPMFFTSMLSGQRSLDRWSYGI